jgi:hypothetical protein
VYAVVVAVNRRSTAIHLSAATVVFDAISVPVTFFIPSFCVAVRYHRTGPVRLGPSAENTSTSPDGSDVGNRKHTRSTISDAVAGGYTLSELLDQARLHVPAAAVHRSAYEPLRGDVVVTDGEPVSTSNAGPPVLPVAIPATVPCSKPAIATMSGWCRAPRQFST